MPVGTITLICGTLCSGKTTLACSICEQHGAVLLSCDKVMRGLHPVDAGFDYEAELKRIKADLLTRAFLLVREGKDTVLDWGFWSKTERSELHLLLLESCIPQKWIVLSPSPEEWARNIAKRNRLVQEHGADEYYIDEGLLRKAESRFEPVSAEELSMLNGESTIMQNTLTKEVYIVPSQCDSTSRLGIPNTFDLLMDIATEHADLLGIGPAYLMRENRFWLTVRARAVFHRRPALTERVTLSTWPEVPEKHRCLRDYTIKAGEELLIEGKSEWVILDRKTGRLLNVASVYPQGLELREDVVLPDRPDRISEDFSGAETLGVYTVRSTDIDLGGHMNNAAYISAFASLFTTEEWNRMSIREIDAVYRTQCFEKEELTALRIKRDDCSDICFQKPDGTIAFLLRYR